MSLDPYVIVPLPLFLFAFSGWLIWTLAKRKKRQRVIGRVRRESHGPERTVEGGGRRTSPFSAGTGCRRTLPAETDRKNRKKRKGRGRRKKGLKGAVRMFVAGAAVAAIGTVSAGAVWYAAAMPRQDGNGSFGGMTQEMVHDILIAAGGVEGDYSPARLIGEEKEMPESELLEKMLRESLYHDLYEEASHAVEGAKAFYVDRVRGIVEGARKPASVIDGISDMTAEEEAIYEGNLKRLDEIEMKKVPEGYTREDVERGLVTPLPLSLDTYQREYGMRWQCCLLKYDPPMLRQAARAAGDAVIMLSGETGRLAELVEYVIYTVTHYLSLMQFKDANESIADCCYWIAKYFYILSEKLAGEHADLAGHCRLMAYAFCAVGMEYLGRPGEKNDHAQDLTELKEGVEARMAI